MLDFNWPLFVFIILALSMSPGDFGIFSFGQVGITCKSSRDTSGCQDTGIEKEIEINQEFYYRKEKGICTKLQILR